MGCGGSKNSANGVANHNPQLQVQSVNSPHPVPKPISFEIPLDPEEGGESLIKKHPPKKFQTLQEQQKPALTQEELDSKFRAAEERRQSILQERVRSSKGHSDRIMKRRQELHDSNGIVVDKIEEEAEGHHSNGNLINTLN